jgi:hypothetical protein
LTRHGGSGLARGRGGQGSGGRGLSRGGGEGDAGGHVLAVDVGAFVQLRGKLTLKKRRIGLKGPCDVHKKFPKIWYKSSEIGQNLAKN